LQSLAPLFSSIICLRVIIKRSLIISRENLAKKKHRDRFYSNETSTRYPNYYMRVSSTLMLKVRFST
jgi:hypothetical protein